VLGRILIADDEAALRDLIATFLQRLGYSCAGALDAQAALELLRKETFDILISDINMPGNENLNFIRKVPEIAEGMPIILLTGNPTFETAAQSVRLPVMAYLTKPVDTNELSILVKQGVAAARANRRQIVAALQETIQVLEKTKRSFKSRELGDLRKKLQLLLEDSSQKDNDRR
jgi:DNA-binding NtrC family response regulator